MAVIDSVFFLLSFFVSLRTNQKTIKKLVLIVICHPSYYALCCQRLGL